MTNLFICHLFTFLCGLCVLVRLVSFSSSSSSSSSRHSSSSRFCKIRGSSCQMYGSRLTPNRYIINSSSLFFFFTCGLFSYSCCVANHFWEKKIFSPAGQVHGCTTATKATAGWGFRGQLQTVPLPPWWGWWRRP